MSRLRIDNRQQEGSSATGFADGRDVRPAADVRTMLVQVRALLLAVLRISLDFRPAYEPLARMALVDPAGAQDLRDRLDDIRQVHNARESAAPSGARAR